MFAGDGVTCQSGTGVTNPAVGVTTAQTSAARALEDWAIAVIVVGAVIFLVVIALLFVCCIRSRRTKDQPHEHLTTSGWFYLINVWS